MGQKVFEVWLNEPTDILLKTQEKKGECADQIPLIDIVNLCDMSDLSKQFNLFDLISVWRFCPVSHVRLARPMM